MADEQLVLRAQVQDAFSAPIAQMARQLRTLVDQNQKGHLQGVAVSKLHTESFMKLFESVHKTSEGFRREFIPAIERLSTEALGLKLVLGGVTAAAAAAASGAAAMAFSFAGGSQSIYDLAESTKVSINFLRQFEALGPRIGVSAQQMAAAAKSYGASMDRLQTHPDAFGVAATQAGMGADVTAWIRTLHGTREQVFDQILKEAEGFKKSGTDYKRRFYDIFGLPPELANKSLQELEDYRTRVRGILRDMSPAAEGGRAANSALLDLKLRVQNLSDTVGAQLSPALRAAADAMGGFLANLTPAPGALDALNASVRALAADPKINDIFAMPDAQGAIGKLNSIVKGSQQLGGILDDLNHHQVDWAEIFNFTQMDVMWDTFKKTWGERFEWVRTHLGVTLGGTTFGAPTGTAPPPSGPPFSFRYDPSKWDPWAATAAPPPIEPPLHDRPPATTTPAPGIFERLKSFLPVAPAEAAPTAPSMPPPPIAPAAPAPFVLPKLGPFELPTGPGAPPPPSMPAFSPIAFGEPAGSTPAAGAGESSAIRIIAVGTRKGVAEGLYDFWQTMRAMTGAGAAARAGGGIVPASYEPPGGGAGGPGTLAGALGGLPGGRTPGSGGAGAGGLPTPAVPPSGGAGIGGGGLGPGHGGAGGGAGAGVGVGARPGSPAGALGEAVRRQAAGGASGSGGGSPGVPYTPGDITKTMGISPEQYQAFTGGVAQIEGGRYDRMGGAGGRFAGRYQMGGAEITETAAQLGEPRPSTQQFLHDPKMQERFMEAYSAEHYKELMREPKFAALSQAQKLEMMGYAHNQGVGGALHYLRSGQAGRDAFGTSGTAYFEPIKKRLDALAREPQSTPSRAFAGLVTPAPPPGPLAQDRHDLAKHGEALREMFGHRGPQKRPDVERLPLPGQQDVSLRSGDLGRRSEPGSLLRQSRQAEAEIHKITGEASLKIALASGLKPVGGVQNKGDLFKKITLDKAAMATASTVG